MHKSLQKLNCKNSLIQVKKIISIHKAAGLANSNKAKGLILLHNILRQRWIILHYHAADSTTITILPEREVGPTPD